MTLFARVMATYTGVQFFRGHGVHLSTGGCNLKILYCLTEANNA